MASFETIDQFDPNEPPPRPTTPPVRRGFLMVLAVLMLLAALVYGIPSIVERSGYAWEAGRARAAGEALEKLDKAGVLKRASALFREATVRVTPAVVNISSLKSIRVPGGRNGFPELKPGDKPGTVRVPTETGSGFVVDKDRGFIVTNHHVVKDAEEIEVRLTGGGRYGAKLVAADPKTDLAVLQINAPLQVAAAWGDSSQVDVGDWVLAIGSPLQLDRTVTAGIISATNRNNLPTISSDTYQDFLQTDAALNPGNSGGPLIDLRGNVVGVNTAIISQTGGDQGIGMAIASNLARRVVGELIKNGRVSRGYLGVSLADVGDDQARRLGLPSPAGALIMDVEPGSPAALAGLRTEDVVVRIGDRPIADRSTLRLRTSELAAGSKVPVIYYRDGKEATTVVTIAELPLLITLGVRLRDLPGDAARQLPGAPEHAVFVFTVDPGSPAALAGVRRGTRVVGVGPSRVATKAEAEAAVAKLDPSQGIPLQIELADGRTTTLIIGGPK